jgi:hypothetical protein
MLELFVIGSFWFWILILIEILVLFVFIEHENGWGATISFLLCLALLQWAGNANIIDFATESPLKLLALVIVYFGLGTVWGVIKWWIFCKDRVDRFRDFKEEFLVSKGLDPNSAMSPELKTELKERLDRDRYDEDNLGKPARVRDNKGNLIRWMSFWPISMVWSLCNDFIKKVFKQIVQWMTTFLQNMSNKIHAGIQKDLEE